MMGCFAKVLAQRAWCCGPRLKRDVAALACTAPQGEIVHLSASTSWLGSDCKHRRHDQTRPHCVRVTRLRYSEHRTGTAENMRRITCLYQVVLVKSDLDVACRSVMRTSIMYPRTSHKRLRAESVIAPFRRQTSRLNGRNRLL